MIIEVLNNIKSPTEASTMLNLRMLHTHTVIKANPDKITLVNNVTKHSIHITKK